MVKGAASADSGGVEGTADKARWNRRIERCSLGGCT